MKLKLIILIVLLAIIVLVAIFVFSNKNKTKTSIKNTTNFRLFFTQGYMKNADTEYEYKFDGDKYIMTIKPYLVDREKSTSFEVDKSVIEEIENILDKYNVYTWDGFDKSDQNVLDGDSFSFYVDMNEKHISAHGYMSWPNNYGSVKSEISTIFEREFEKNK